MKTLILVILDTGTCLQGGREVDDFMKFLASNADSKDEVNAAMGGEKKKKKKTEL